MYRKGRGGWSEGGIDILTVLNIFESVIRLIEIYLIDNKNNNILYFLVIDTYYNRNGKILSSDHDVGCCILTHIRPFSVKKPEYEHVTVLFWLFFQIDAHRNKMYLYY